MPKLVGKNVRGTSYKITFPTLPGRPVQPSLVQLRQTQGEHEMLTLEFRSTIPSWLTTLKTGIPVKFEWYQGKQSNTWLGYVSYISKEASAQKHQPMIIRCIGASFVLKQSEQRVFKNKTIQEVARILATENGLAFSGDTVPNQARYDQLVITGQSYWEWLQTHAERIGCAAYVSGTTLYLKRITSLLDQGSTDVPLLQLWDTSIPAFAVGVERTLSYFKVLNGEYVESETNVRSQKLSGGVDPVTGRASYASATPKKDATGLRKVTSDVLFNEAVTNRVAHGAVMTRSIAEGAAFLSQFSIPAKAIGQGDPRIKPYFPVYVDGTGAESDGYWMVKDALHEFHISGEYKVTLRLLTDGLGANRSSMYRQATTSGAGTVNLKQALITGTTQLSTSPVKTSKLTKKTAIIKQGNQGFSRTPTLWKTTLKGAR